ncbi:MAG: hypothetical protein PHQ45_05515 [Acidaminococcaceae bacterium]|nr:hypothetical protein [Acidaminococcaceae bacterium]
MQLDPQEWKAYVDFVSGGEWPIPRGFISNYDNWLCRSMVGRALYFREKPEEAMAVLSTVLAVEPSMEKPEANSMSEVEHKILCLRDLAKIIWGFTHNNEAAIKYWDEAVEWCRKWPYNFHSIARGEISYGRVGQLWEAQEQELADKYLHEMAKSDHFEMQQYNVNSNRYYAYKFMAEREHAAGNIQKAAIMYEEAFKYYPMSVEARRNEADAKAQKDPESKYNKCVEMSKRQYLLWEEIEGLRAPRRG